MTSVSRPDYSADDIDWSKPWYGYESVCAGASLGETISNCDSSKLGRLSYDSPDVRGTESALPARGGDAPARRRDGARDDEESVDEMLGWCARIRALAFDTFDCRLAEREVVPDR